MVETTGMPVFSAKEISSSRAPASTTPPPQQRSGRFACSNGRGRLAHLHGVSLRAGLVAGNLCFLRVDERVDLLFLHVGRHVDENGAGTPGRSNIKCLLEDAREIRRVLDEVRVFGEGLAGAGDVGFLKHVAAEEPLVDLPGDGDERNGIHVRRGDAGDEVRRAGAGCGDAHAGNSGGAGISARFMGGVLFFAHKDVFDRRNGTENHRTGRLPRPDSRIRS